MTPGGRWRARWVLPVADAPIRDGAVAVEDGLIVACGPAAALARSHPGPERDLGDAVLLPGLVDAHCHLEWSLAGGIPAGPFHEWLPRMLAFADRVDAEAREAAVDGGALMCLRAGTTTLADSGPTGAGALALSRAGLRGTTHLEVFGTGLGASGARERTRSAAAAIARLEEALGETAGRVGVGLSPHAPYTVDRELWHALRAEAVTSGRPWATHLAESPAERELMTTGAGPLPGVYAPRGFAPARWPGAGGTVSRLAEAGALRTGMVAAHCVHVDDAEAAALAAAGVGVALCPASNRRLRCGRAPLERLRAAGAAVGLGTDSPASAGNFDLRAEALELAEQAVAAGEPVAAGALVELITAGSARALGREREVGALRPGLRADLCAVALPGPLLPLADADPAAAALDPRALVAMVAVDGRVLLDGGAPALVDPEAIAARAARARKHLC